MCKKPRNQKNHLKPTEPLPKFRFGFSSVWFRFYYGENSQIPRFGKICGKLTLFRKYLVNYHFFSTRVSQKQVQNSTRV